MPSRVLPAKAILCATGSRHKHKSGTGLRPRTVVAHPSHGSIRRRSASLLLILSDPPSSSLLHSRHHHNSTQMDDTLAKLFNSNEQWSEAVKAADPKFFENSAKGQSPKILWLGCSDSRVPESVITASPPGYIFVHRNIANQIHPDDDSALAVLTYAIGHMPGIEHIVVVGHTNCGGAKAALAAATSPEPPKGEPVLLRWLTPLLELAKGLVSGPALPDVLTRLIEESVTVQVNNVANSEPVRKAWAEGRKNLTVHGLVYELETGRLRDLKVTKQSTA